MSRRSAPLFLTAPALPVLYFGVRSVTPTDNPSQSHPGELASHASETASGSTVRSPGRVRHRSVVIRSCIRIVPARIGVGPIFPGALPHSGRRTWHGRHFHAHANDLASGRQKGILGTSYQSRLRRVSRSGTIAQVQCAPQVLGCGHEHGSGLSHRRRQHHHRKADDHKLNQRLHHIPPNSCPCECFWHHSTYLTRSARKSSVSSHLPRRFLCHRSPGNNPSKRGSLRRAGPQRDLTRVCRPRNIPFQGILTDTLSGSHHTRTVEKNQ